MKTALVIFVFLCLQDSASSYGTEYLLAFPQNNYDDDRDNAIWLLVTPANGRLTPVSVNLWDPDDSNVEDYPKSLTLTNGETRKLILPKELKMPLGCSLQSNHTVLVTASEEIVVVVRNEGHSNSDLHLALPISEFGNEYFVLSLQPPGHDSVTPAAFIVIVSNDDHNVVSVALPMATETSRAFIFYDGMYYTNRDVITVVLDQYDAFQLQAVFDLTGTRIASTAPVGVWSGLNRTKTIESCLSHASAMLPPVERYGYTYVLITNPGSTTLHAFRILAREANTWVSVYDPGQTAPYLYYLAHPGDFVEISIGQTVNVYANASNPVLIASFPTTSPGDAMMKILTPIESPQETTYSLLGYGSFHLTFIIDRGSDTGLIFKGKQLTEDDTDWWYMAYDVSGKNDLIVGVISVSDSDDGTEYNFSHSSNVAFMVYIDMLQSCEGEGTPLVSSMTEYPVTTNTETGIDECYYLLDHEGKAQSHLGQSCSLGGTEFTYCIDNTGKVVYCKESGLNHQCTTWPYRRTAVSYQYTAQHSSVTCYDTCVKTTGCIGANYVSTDGVVQNCELLFEKFQGFVPSTSWSFIACSSKTKFIEITDDTLHF